MTELTVSAEILITITTAIVGPLVAFFIRKERADAKEKTELKTNLAHVQDCIQRIEKNELEFHNKFTMQAEKMDDLIDLIHTDSKILNSIVNSNIHTLSDHEQRIRVIEQR